MYVPLFQRANKRSERAGGHMRAAQLLIGAQAAGKIVQLGLFFICHPTRERLCVQGVVALSVQRVETQHGDWSVALAHERARAEFIMADGNPAPACPT